MMMMERRETKIYIYLQIYKDILITPQKPYMNGTENTHTKKRPRASPHNLTLLPFLPRSHFEAPLTLLIIPLFFPFPLFFTLFSKVFYLLFLAITQ